MQGHLLSIIILLPLLVGLLLLILPRSLYPYFKWITLFTGIIQFIFCLWALIIFDKDLSQGYLQSFQFVEKYRWITFSLTDSLQFSIDYHIGADGVGILLTVLSSFIMIIATISSWAQELQRKGYFVLFNILNASIVGCFLALDFFLFYLFFELMLLPMFFMIGIWGGPRRAYASVKFFLYTLFGSVLILIVMIGVYLGVTEPGTQVHTFNLLYISDVANVSPDAFLHPSSSESFLGYTPRLIAFLLLLIGFAIKLPVVPFHTWLPDAHVEAPTAISVILAGLLLKVGGYGIFRFAYGLFPEGGYTFGPLIAFFGILSIVYGGLNALAQRDIKRMIAYSSVSHMGFVLLGLASITIEGFTGSIFHMLSHGLISAALFLIAGVIYDRTGDRRIENYSGLAYQLKGYTFVVVVVFFASLGLPGLSGFVGEILVFIGAFSSATTNSLVPRWIAIASVSGVIISATYYLWTLQRMFFGNFWVRKEEWLDQFTDLTRREWLVFIPLLVLILVLGVYPRLAIDFLDQSISVFLSHISAIGSESTIN